MSAASSSPYRWRWVALAVSILGMAVLVLEATPRVREALTGAAEWQEAQRRLADARNAPVQLASLRSRRTELQRELAKLPGAAALSPRAVLVSVQAAAADAGVEVNRLEPGAAETDGALERRPLQIAVRGSYDAIGRFVAGMERSSSGAPPIRVVELEVSWADQKVPARSDAPLAATLRAESIRVLHAPPP